MTAKVIKFNLQQLYEAPREKAFEIWSRLEDYPRYHPEVFKEVRIAERSGNTLITDEITETVPGVRINGRGRHVFNPPERYLREHLVGDLAGTSREQVFESLPDGRSKVTMHMRMVIAQRTLAAMGDDWVENVKGVNAQQMCVIARVIEGRDEPRHAVLETPLIAFHTAGFGDEPLESVLPAISDAGFDAVELNAETLPWCGPHVWPGMAKADKQRVVSLLEKSRLTVTSICAHIPMIEAQAAQRRDAVNYVKGCIDLAVDFGTDVVHGLSGTLTQGVSEEQAWEWLVAAMNECASYAELRKVRFAVEPVTGMLVARSEHFARLKEAMSKPLYLNLDPSHLLVEGDDPVTVVRRWAGNIAHVHIKDARGRSGDFSFPPLGEGDLDFDAFFAALRAIDYAGACSVEDEAHAFGYAFEPRQTAKQTLAFLRAATGVKF